MITAIIDAGQHYCQAVSDLWQWDYGQTLRIQGVTLPAAVEIQFSTTERVGETVTRIGVTKEGITEVPIPDTLLEGGGTTQDYTIYAFVYIENGDSGKTEYRVSMKVRARPKPEAHATPEEGELFRQAIVAVTESADRAECARDLAETAADQAVAAKEAAETASDTAVTASETAVRSAASTETAKEAAEAARSEAVRAATESTDAKDSADKSRAAAEKAKQDAGAAKAAADTDKEAAETARTKAEAAQKAAENAETETKKAKTATETARRETETAKTAVETMQSTVAGYAYNANIAKESAETARSEAETAKNDAVQAKEAAEKAKSGTAADRETAETASKVAQISATSAEESAKKAEAAKEEIQESADQIQKNETEIDSLKEDIDYLLIRSRNLLNLETVTHDTWISNTSGNIQSYTGYTSSDYIFIDGISTIFFVYLNNSVYVDAGGFFGAYYDVNKTYIKGFAGVTLGATIPSNAKYVRVSNESKYFSEEVKPILTSIDIWNPKPTQPSEYEKYGDKYFDDSENLLPNVYAAIEQLENRSYTIPNYYKEHILTKELKIRQNYDKCGVNGDSFVFITDYHDTSNSGNSINLIRHIMEDSPVGFVCLNGDLINDKTTKDLGRQSMINVIQKFCYLPTDKFFVTVGNHEFNNAGNSESYRDRQLSIGEVYSIINKKSETFIRDVDGYDYYVDNKAQKIRYYFLGSTIGSNPYSGVTKWIAKSLADIENGYSAIIFSHIGLNSSTNDWESSFDKIVAILEAYKNHTTYMLDGENYDFSLKEGDVIGIFSGHMHLDGAINTNAGIPFISTTCDAYNEEYGKLTREKDTVTEQAFDVVQVDRNNRKIYMTRIGAGNDREFSY